MSDGWERHAYNAGTLTDAALLQQSVPIFLSAMKTIRSFVSSVLLTLATAACAQIPVSPVGTPQMHLPRATMQVGRQSFSVQLARTEPEKETGLMYRTRMPANEGMLFLFDRPGIQCFWMRNTRLPLTAAFVADDGTIVNLEDMQPMTETNHCSARPVRYVLEMNQGWFAHHHVRAGMRIRHALFRPAAAARTPARTAHGA